MYTSRKAVDYQGVRWKAVFGMYPGDTAGNYWNYFVFIASVIMLVKIDYWHLNSLSSWFPHNFRQFIKHRGMLCK